MKKEDFTAIGISEDLAQKCADASADELKGFIPKARFNEVNEENKTLKQTVTDRDKQLEELKKSSGDNAELKKQIEALQQQNSEQQKTHAAELARLKLDNAVDTALVAAGAKNIKAVKPFVDLSKLTLGEDGKLSGLDEQLKAVRQSDGYLFEDATKAQPSFKGFQPGFSNTGDAGKPGADIDPSKMTYSQLAAYMAANPDVKI